MRRCADSQTFVAAGTIESSFAASRTDARGRGTGDVAKAMTARVHTVGAIQVIRARCSTRKQITSLFIAGDQKIHGQ